LPAAVERSTVCVAPAIRPEGTGVVPGVRGDAWMLGMRMGLHARAALILAERERTATPETRDQLEGVRLMIAASAAEIQRLSAALRVPVPATFVPTNPAMENVDFPPFVEAGGNQTAKTLAATYGTDACRLFQMGAYWGHSALVRTVLPGEPNIHGAEIRHYAQLVGLPESLWRPMVERTAGNASGETLATEVDRATAALTTHLRAEDASAARPPRK
jgi:hypothetical protein